MTRLINADALHDDLRKEQRWIVHRDGYVNEGYSYDQVHFAIDKQPTVESEPVRHGRWIKHDDGRVRPFWEKYECSQCGTMADSSNYCPNCGAKMDAERKEE